MDDEVRFYIDFILVVNPWGSPTRVIDLTPASFVKYLPWITCQHSPHWTTMTVRGGCALLMIRAPKAMDTHQNVFKHIQPYALGWS